MFDDSGNTTRDPQLRKFTYDAENKQVNVESVNSGGTVTGTIGEYVYDGDGMRIKKIVPSPVAPFNDEVTVFVYDAAGKLVAEYASEISQDPKVSYTTADHLGSPRILTDENGATISRRDFHPFGEEILTTHRHPDHGYTPDDVRQKFTGYERDEETDLEFAQARMYSKGLGRFSGADPLHSSGRITDPRTWNRYSYAINSPLKYTDPFGAYIFTEALGGDLSDAKLLENAGEDKKKLSDAQKIIKKRDKIRQGIADARAAGAKSDDPDAVNNAIDAYGGDLVNNGVVVGFGKTGGKPGVTTAFKNENGAYFSISPDGNSVMANVLVLFNDNAGTEDFINAVAHEGQHAADRQGVANAINDTTDPNFNYWESTANVNVKTTETRAYYVSAMIAQGRGQPSWSPGGYEIWNSGWKKAERMDNISKGIEKLLTSSKTYKNKLNDRIYEPK